MNLEQLVERHPLIFKGQMPPWSDVPTGWIGVVDELCTALAHEMSYEELMDLQVLQVKEKFGRLEFYVGRVSKQCYRRIDELSAKSRQVCQDCSAPGRLRNNQGWVSTLCDFCQKELEIRMGRSGHPDLRSLRLRHVGKRPPPDER